MDRKLCNNKLTWCFHKLNKNICFIIESTRFLKKTPHNLFNQKRFVTLKNILILCSDRLFQTQSVKTNDLLSERKSVYIAAIGPKLTCLVKQNNVINVTMTFQACDFTKLGCPHFLRHCVAWVRPDNKTIEA